MNSNKQNARNVNKKFANGAYDPSEAGKKGGAAPRRRSKRLVINDVMDSIAGKVNFAAKQMPALGNLESLIVYKVLEGATRDNQHLRVFCDQVKSFVSIEELVQVPCPECGEMHSVIAPDAKLEDQSQKDRHKLLDKLFPNKTELSGTVEVEGKMEEVSEAIGVLIQEFVPQDKLAEFAIKYKELLENVQDEQGGF